MSAPSHQISYSQDRYPMLATVLDRAIEATIFVLTAFIMTVPVALLVIGWPGRRAVVLSPASSARCGQTAHASFPA